MSKSCTVLVATSDVLPALKERADREGDEILAFTDAEALKALEAITKTHPRVVALERLFAATPRGAALINRIKADPSLSDTDVMIVTRDSDFGSLLRPSSRMDTPGGDTGGLAAVAAAPPVAATTPLDQTGTRRAVRFRIRSRVNVLVDGNNASLVNLSTVGAQVVSPTVLKPNQRVRMSLVDEEGAVRFRASVAWASFEIPPEGSPQYRAGLAFIDANGAAVDEYCSRHKV